jgi:two-component system cell cycle sensor histidine kinase/response regulator CckA
MAGELVGEIREAALRARDLTRQLLGFARKQVFQPQVLDLGAVLRRSERLLRRVLGEHVALTVRAAPGPGLVRFDPGQLEQVILNLAMNARDAMPQGGSLTLAVAELDSGSPGARLYPDLPDGSYLELEVTDTGQGMTPKVAARAFEPFFTTKAVGKGHGLGLSTVHGIVKQNGGAIRCRTTPGQGTSFLLCLPRAPAGARVAPTLTPPAAVAPGRGSERVLLVEDDAEVLKAGVRVLEGSGYAVTVARDGLDALARVTSGGERFDLVVSDVVMPGLDGSALLGELRAHQPGLRALLVSGHGDDVLRDRAVLREGTEFLAKPFTSQELLSRVRRILDVGRVG